MATTEELIRQAIEEDPTGDDALDLVLFLLQDPVAREEIPEALENLKNSDVNEQAERFEAEVLPQAQEMIESGSINGVPVIEMNRQSPGEYFAETAGAGLDVGAAAAGAAATAASFTPVGRGVSLGARLAGRIIKSGLGWAGSHKRLTGLGLAGVGSWLYSTSPLNDADPGTGSDHNAASPDPQRPPEGGGGFFYQDPSTGQVTQLDVPAEAQTGMDPESLGGEPAFGPGLTGAAFVDQALANGVGLGAGPGFGMGAASEVLGRNFLNSRKLDEPITLDPIRRFQRGSVPGTGLPPPEGTGTLGVEDNFPSMFTGAGFGMGASSVGGEPTYGGLPRESLGELEIPGDAELAPRAFSEYQGRTLIDWARIYSAKYRVPLNVLYGLVDLESGWDPNAMGDEVNGSPTSFGLVQIHRPAFPNIGRSQALNPKFALDFAARMLRERFDKYGRWDAAVAAHNSPLAADYLAQTGQFYNAKSQSYTTTVLEKANLSGLASTAFSGENLDQVAGVGTDMGGESAVFPVDGAQLPNASQIGLPRDGGARQHQGLDIMADDGTPVYATTAGRVRYAANRGGKGGYAVSIEDQHGNWHYYAHLSPQSAGLWQQTGIVEGAMVQPGSLIGYVGSTGNASGGAPHLHYSINEGRKDAPLIDPWDWLQGSNMTPEDEFQAFRAPDPDTSRDWIRTVFADLLGRDPSEEELHEGTQQLTALSRENYNRGIQSARGLETTALDPQAAFKEELRESGEFEFAQERTELRSFTDYAANIARMLQGGL